MTLAGAMRWVWVRIPWPADWFAWILLLLVGYVAFELLRPNVYNPRGWTNRGIAETQMANFEHALRSFREEHKRLPTSLQELTVPTADGEPWMKSISNDPWDRPYDYQVAGGGFTLRSWGQDGRPDTDDDLRWPRGE